MNKEAFTKVKGTLPKKRHSSDDIVNREQMLQVLEKDRIRSDMEMTPMQFLLHMLNRPCFPRGELVAVTGKAKSGKTYFTSMLMAACTADSVVGISRPTGLPPLRCLWYDTEQSRQSTLEILKERIKPLAGNHYAEELYDVFNVRSRNWEQRMDLLELAIGECRPDMVVCDNVCDLIHDINDGPGNKVAMEKLMRMAQNNKCCIVIVIHQNKTGEDRNPRGSVGTEVLNKSFEVYACELMRPQQLFAVEQTHSRKCRMDELLYFVIDEEGLPKLSSAPQPTITSNMGDTTEKMPPMNEQYVSWVDGQMQVDLRSLFCDVLKSGALYYSNLQKSTMELLGCKSTGYWNKLFNQAKNLGIIVNKHNQEGKSIWALAPKSDPVEMDLYTEAPAVDEPPF